MGGGASPSKPEQEKTVALNMAMGNQTIEPDEGYVLSGVTVEKPSTLIAGNIKDGVNIGGVVGTLQGVDTPALSLTLSDTGAITGAKFYDFIIIPAGICETQLELTTVDFTNSKQCREIQDKAFYNCTRAIITLPQTLETIGMGAFEKCGLILGTNLPNLLKRIGARAFVGVGTLGFSELPPTLLTIDDNAQVPMSMSLTELNIPVGVTALGEGAFKTIAMEVTVNFLGTPSENGLSSKLFSQMPGVTAINVPWAEGAVANAPWGATNATITYNYTE